MNPATFKSFVIGNRDWSIGDVVEASRGRAVLSLCAEQSWIKHVEKSRSFLQTCLANGTEVYGVTTGYGDSSNCVVPQELISELPYQLVRYHGCGMGKALNSASVRAMIIARLVCLARGYSGVRLEVLEGLVQLLNNEIIPIVPEEGSVGASGDLTPLSYVAATLLGEGLVTYRNEQISAREALSKAGLTPMELLPKEALALMNGTSMMTGLSCLAFDRAQYLARLSSVVTGLAVVGLRGNTTHYNARLFELKPHPGQMTVAAWVRNTIGWKISSRPTTIIQDPYSFRCAPHVVGVLVDVLPTLRTLIETELNSSNDNPLIDPEEEQVLHGGHFYGGHLAFAMDSLKNLVANIADLMDRQLAVLVNRTTNRGLPANLSGADVARLSINHGFKAVQIAVSAWTAEALKLTMPASVFSRSTECHNQDKVSMGSIAARECHRILDLGEQVVAAQLIATLQAIQLRIKLKNISQDDLSEIARNVIEVCSEKFSCLEEDRPLEQTIRDVVDLIHLQRFAIPE